MRLISWNVNGIRAVMKKEFMQSFATMAPDVLCLQETKAQDEQTFEALKQLDGWFIYTNSAERKGYSGTALISKQEPLKVTYDMGIAEHDSEGRVICAEYDDYFLVTVYTPNSGSDLKRLEYRKTWDAAFLNYLQELETKKPLFVCGDLNVAHKAIDLKRPKENYNKSAGFTQTEIDGIDNYIKAGFIDTFRHTREDEVKYSWWSYRAGARARNVGWRIDYFLCSPALIKNVQYADYFNDIMGSDHCPVMIDIV